MCVNVDSVPKALETSMNTVLRGDKKFATRRTAKLNSVCSLN